MSCFQVITTCYPPELMTWHFNYHPHWHSVDKQSVGSSALVVSRWCWPGNRTYLDVDSMAVSWWIVAFLHCGSIVIYVHTMDSFISHLKCMLLRLFNRMNRWTWPINIYRWLDVDEDDKETERTIKRTDISDGRLIWAFMKWWKYLGYSLVLREDIVLVLVTSSKQSAWWLG